MLFLIEPILNGELLRALGSLETLLLGYYFFIFSKKVGRDKVAKRLEPLSTNNAYSDIIGEKLKLLNELFLPQHGRLTVVNFGSSEHGLKIDDLWVPKARTEKEAQLASSNPFSWVTLDFCLKMAVIYPMLFIFSNWTYFGGDGYIGSYIALPAVESSYIRYSIFFVALISFFASLRSKFLIDKHSLRHAVPILAKNLMFFFFMTLVPSILFGLAVLNPLAHVSVFVFALVLAFFIVVHFSGIITLCVATSFVAAASIAAAGLEGGSLNGGGSLGFIFAFSLCVSIAIVLVMQMDKGLNPLVGYAILCTILFFLMVAAAYIVPGNSFDVRTWLLFLGVFPLINGIFDYFSFGFTRLFVYLGKDSGWLGTLFFAFLDVVVAWVLFSILAATLISAVFLLNQVSSKPFLDILEVLRGVGENPKNYIWLFAALLSAVIPTLIHFVVSMWALIGILKDSWRLALIEQIKTGENIIEWAKAAFTLSLVVTLLCALPVFVILLLKAFIFPYLVELAPYYLEIFVIFTNFLEV